MDIFLLLLLVLYFLVFVFWFWEKNFNLLSTFSYFFIFLYWSCFNRTNQPFHLYLQQSFKYMNNIYSSFYYNNILGKFFKEFFCFIILFKSFCCFYYNVCHSNNLLTLKTLFFCFFRWQLAYGIVSVGTHLRFF